MGFMDARQAELRRLWDKILECERVMRVKSGADFEAKKREMAALQAAYARVSGTSCNPSNWRENEIKGDRQFYGQAAQGDFESQPTTDRLNDFPPGYKPFKTRMD